MKHARTLDLRTAMRLPVSIRTYLIMGGVMTVFLVCCAHTNGGPTLHWVLFSFGVSMASTGSVFLMDLTDAWRYRPAVVEGRLVWLKELGLQEERVEDYQGYRGSYRGYFIRVYYDPCTYHLRTSRYRHAFCTVVYFTPPWRSDGKRDMVRWRKFQEDLVPDVFFNFRTSRMSYSSAFLVHYTPFHRSTERRTMVKYMDEAIDKVLQHGFPPLEEATVDRLVKKDPYLHGPDIDSFRNAFVRAS